MITQKRVWNPKVAMKDQIFFLFNFQETVLKTFFKSLNPLAPKIWLLILPL